MDGRQSDYQQPDQASAAPYPPSQDPRGANNFSSSATPTSEYGLQPQSARSSNFPEYIQRQQAYPQQAAQGGNMAHAQNPSIAAASPTYAQQHQYSPHQFQHHDNPMYPMNPADYGRQQWPGSHYQTPPHMSGYGHPASTGPSTPALVSPGGHPLSTVYSFVPIPGAQQHKRPRRRYEEIERMYKCGWNGCEKAYGTLNHLNAHVTMQSHGAKRTPEEFKEIRKEWKAKKKEEEAARKADDDRHRQSDSRAGEQANTAEQPVYAHMRQPIGPPPSMGGPQLPPIGYGPNSGGQSAAQYAQPSPALEGSMQQHGGYPQSPYSQGNQIR